MFLILSLNVSLPQELIFPVITVNEVNRKTEFIHTVWKESKYGISCFGPYFLVLRPNSEIYGLFGHFAFGHFSHSVSVLAIIN